MVRFALLISAAVAVTAWTGPAMACGEVYTVRAGDSLGRIAQRCDTGLRALRAANPRIRPDQLRVGQELTIPGGGPKVQAGPAVELKGWIVNGRRCALIETADGTRFGIVSSKIPFITGRRVKVQGKMVKGAGCRPDQTMLVTVLENVAGN